jgi:hypothetical protein
MEVINGRGRLVLVRGEVQFGNHHIDGGVSNACVCACANHIRPTRGTRRELGL